MGSHRHGKAGTLMTKLTTATLALLLAGSLTACAKTPETPTLPSGSLPTAAASTTPGDTMTSGPTPDDTTAGGSATTASGSATTRDRRAGHARPVDPRGRDDLLARRHGGR